MPSRAAVHGALGWRRGILDHGSRSDNQHPGSQEADGDRVPGPCENSRVRLPGHAHAFGRRVLVEPVEVGETDGLEFVEADPNRVGLARRLPDRPETPAPHVTADATRHERAGHWLRAYAHNTRLSTAGAFAAPRGHLSSRATRLFGYDSLDALALIWRQPARAGSGGQRLEGVEPEDAEVTILLFTLLVGGGSIVAGLLGSLTGLGGGVVIVPLLTLAFGVDIRYAIGASLVSVIATSSGAAAAYVREGYSNIRIGMVLEIATTLGALGGAALATHLPTRIIAIVFGVALLVSAWLSIRPPREAAISEVADPIAARLSLDSSYPTPEGPRPYRVHSVGTGFGLMGLAGALSGLLGIGSGAVKVLAMDQVMRIPFKVSTTTSNFMIGVTAAASAGVYLSRGYIDPGLAMPVMLGVVAGSMLGARLLAGAPTRVLRLLFGVVVAALAIEMLYQGARGTP